MYCVTIKVGLHRKLQNNVSKQNVIFYTCIFSKWQNNKLKTVRKNNILKESILFPAYPIISYFHHHYFILNS